MASQPKLQRKNRLCVLPMGLYPRRITIYLQEKRIADKFDVIPVDVGPEGMETVEGKPPGTLPILEIRRPEGNDLGGYIFQSNAILEYLEDIYADHVPNMRGTTPEIRARTRECMDVVNEATTWLVLYVQNGSSFYAQFRGQERGAAKEGLERMHKALNLLETLADAKGPFVVGKSPMVVDCVLVASVQFAKAVYGVDMVGEHPKLKKIVEAFEARGTAVFPELPGFMEEGGNFMSVS